MPELSTTPGGAPRMPPTLAHREQNAAAGEIGNNQQRNQNAWVDDTQKHWQEVANRANAGAWVDDTQGYRQAAAEGAEPGNLMKGDIGSEPAPSAAPAEEETATTPPTTPPERQAEIAAQVSQAQNIKNKISQVRQSIIKNAQGIRGSLLKGKFIFLLRKIPGIGALIASFENMIQKNIDRAIVILEFIKKRLQNLETLIAEGEGIKKWLQIFIESLETIIIPIILILLFPPWLVVIAMHPTLFSGTTRKISEFIKLNIDPVLEKLKALSQRTKNEKAALLRTRQLEAAVQAQTTAVSPP